MKPYLIILFFLGLISCNESERKTSHTQTKPTEKIIPVLESLLDSNNLEGAILIYDIQEQTYYSNSFNEAKKQVLPASTFKIPNSIIGLETGILKDEETVFKWDGNKRSFPMWEKDLSLKEAFQASCVPCYQELAIEVGLDTMLSYLEKLPYPGMDVNSENLNNFWLLGESKISPWQQVDFLKRLYNNKLPISTNTLSTMKEILKAESNDNYVLSAKSGWAASEEINIGWYVGYVEKGDLLYFFATRINPEEEFEMNNFIPIRKQITIEAFKQLNLLE